MNKKQTKIEKEFFNKLTDKLEEIFPKTNQDNPKIPSKGNRSGALTFNAWANIYLEEALKAQKQEFKKLITKEIVITQLEGQPTSRLTSLFVKLKQK